MMASTMLAIAAHVFTAVLPGFQIANGSFTLNGVPTRLFAGSLQLFRIHPDHWEHRLATAKAMGLNAVQTLTPWMMMEPSPGEFISTGILDIVRFSKLAHAAGLLVVLRPGPFICDGPDFGGLPWWLSQQNNPDLLVPGERPTSQLRVRTADPAFLRRVDIFTTKLFALLRTNNLTADLGGPIVMAQIENEYGLFGSDYAYLEHLRDTWRAGLGPGVVIHSTDPPTSKVLGGSRIPGVLQTIDFGYTSDPAGPFAELKASQAMVNTEPQPLMCSEIYPGTLTYWGDSTFPVIYPPTSVAASIDKILDTEHCGGSTSFALWLFAACTDFGWWGGVLELWSGASAWRALVPTYDFGAPVDESGVVRPLFYLLQDVLRKHGAVIPEGGLPPPPPCRGYGAVTMTESLLLWDALPSLLATTALTPDGTPIASATVRTMEEIGQGYGLILYSAPIVPSQVAAGRVETVVMAGMRDRAEVYLDYKLHQVCGRGSTVDTDSCESPIPVVPGSPAPQKLDILVENFGRVTGGFQDSQGFRGIGRWVSISSQTVANWSISPLPLDNVATALGTNATSPVTAKWGKANASLTPAFFRGRFTIAAGDVADTFLNVKGWLKGQAFVNGHNLARYWGAVGPQYTFYCPAGWLHAGENEVILFETGGANPSLTVTFTSTHLTVGGVPAHDWQPCPAGYQTHQRGYWDNPTPPAASGGDKVNHTVALCSAKCTTTAGCLAFEIYEQTSCYIFVDELKEPAFVSDNKAGVTCKKVEQ